MSLMTSLSISQSVFSRPQRGVSRLYPVPILCTLVLIGGRSYAGTQGNDTFTLVKPTFNVGETRRYMGTVFSREKLSKSAPVTKMIEKCGMTVKEAKADGSAVLIFKSEALHTYVQGKEMPTTKLPAMVIYARSAQGKVTQTYGEGKETTAPHLVSGAFEFLEPLRPLIPTKPVHIGEHWDITYLFSGLKPQKGMAELFAGEPIAGEETFRIRIVSADTKKDPSEVIHMEAWLVISRTSGDILKFAQISYMGPHSDIPAIRIVLTSLGKDPKDDSKEEEK